MDIDINNLPPNAESLMLVLHKLRSPGGCPWDQKQTSKSLLVCLREECAELIEAIDNGDNFAICDELGDVLMNVLLQVVIAEEKKDFTYSDVMANVIAKMIRRHAHVFGNENAEKVDDVLKLWEKIKEQERKNKPKRESVLDGISPEMSSLDRAEKIQKRAASVGFDWEKQEDILDKISEELSELKEAYKNNSDCEIEDELGDLFFAASNLARFRKASSSEELLRRATKKFEQRFRYMERYVKQENINWDSLCASEKEELWQKVKKELNNA